MEEEQFKNEKSLKKSIKVCKMNQKDSNKTMNLGSMSNWQVTFFKSCASFEDHFSIYQIIQLKRIFEPSFVKSVHFLLLSMTMQVFPWHRDDNGFQIIISLSLWLQILWGSSSSAQVFLNRPSLIPKWQFRLIHRHHRRRRRRRQWQKPI